MSIRAFILDQIKSIAEQNRKSLPPISDAVVITDSGFDSLCMALLVAVLEDHYNVDPLADDTAQTPVTFGDLISLYQRATDEHVSG
jgi:acyl carrier protein